MSRSRRLAGTISSAEERSALARGERRSGPADRGPEVYPEIEDGATFVHARTAEEDGAALIAPIEDRERIGTRARAYVTEHRRAQVAAERWRDVLLEVAPVAA